MEVVAGDVTRVALGDLALRVREIVPDGSAAAALLGSAFDLVGGGGGSPQEAIREVDGWTFDHVRRR